MPSERRITDLTAYESENSKLKTSCKQFMHENWRRRTPNPRSCEVVGGRGATKGATSMHSCLAIESRASTYIDSSTSVLVTHSQFYWTNLKHLLSSECRTRALATHQQCKRDDREVRNKRYQLSAKTPASHARKLVPQNPNPNPHRVQPGPLPRSALRCGQGGF